MKIPEGSCVEILKLMLNPHENAKKSKIHQTLEIEEQSWWTTLILKLIIKPGRQRGMNTKVNINQWNKTESKYRSTCT